MDILDTEAKNWFTLYTGSTATTDREVTMNITATVTEFPTVEATKVVREDQLAWWVECEGTGCANVITVGKRSYKPNDYRDESKGMTKVEATAPAARRCSACGPFAG
jgi:hypothetical protein